MERSAADLAIGDDVDQAFAGMMIGYHLGAIDMMEKYAAGEHG